MRIAIVVFALIASSSAMGSSPAKTDGEVIIFLHNAFFEKNKEGQAHERFGAYDFDGIKAALGGGTPSLLQSAGPVPTRSRPLTLW